MVHQAHQRLGMGTFLSQRRPERVAQAMEIHTSRRHMVPTGRTGVQPGGAEYQPQRRENRAFPTLSLDVTWPLD
jgi:hypothetical protein